MHEVIKSDKPLAFGVTSSPDTPIFGLSENPVLLFVGFDLFVRPGLRLLAGHRVMQRPTVNMVRHDRYVGGVTANSISCMRKPGSARMVTCTPSGSHARVLTY